ncbi:MAG: tetratricopeptide repeat protein [Micavibrio sp.]
MSFDALRILQEAGGKADSDLNLVTLSIALAAPAHPGIVTDRYFNHFSKAATQVGERYCALLNAGARDDAAVRLAALKHILADAENYHADNAAAGDLGDIENTDMIRVMDRRKGHVAALAILYIQAGRDNSWELDGLDFPGHFLCRIQHGGERIIFDPANGCARMEAPQLRALVKEKAGEGAELSASYYTPCPNRDILLTLHNILKSRYIRGEDYGAALGCVERMRLFAPDDHRLWLDAGVLYAKTGDRARAAGELEKYIAAVPDARDRLDAEAFLRSIVD